MGSKQTGYDPDGDGRHDHSTASLSLPSTTLSSGATVALVYAPEKEAVTPLLKLKINGSQRCQVAIYTVGWDSALRVGNRFYTDFINGAFAGERPLQLAQHAANQFAQKKTHMGERAAAEGREDKIDDVADGSVEKRSATVLRRGAAQYFEGEKRGAAATGKRKKRGAGATGLEKQKTGAAAKEDDEETRGAAAKKVTGMQRGAAVDGAKGISEVLPPQGLRRKRQALLPRAMMRRREVLSPTIWREVLLPRRAMRRRAVLPPRAERRRKKMLPPRKVGRQRKKKMLPPRKMERMRM